MARGRKKMVRLLQLLFESNHFNSVFLSQSGVLLSSGAFVGRKNKEGDTALHLASSIEVADLAIQAGAVTV